MTSTSTFPGMHTEGKPSSRVLRPPGGGSSNIFGGYESPQQTTQKPTEDPVVEETQSPQVSSSVEHSEPSQDLPKPDQANTQAETESPREAQKGYKKRESYNPITGELIGSGDTKPAPTSTKVHHPPGGKSTALW